MTLAARFPLLNQDTLPLSPALSPKGERENGA